MEKPESLSVANAVLNGEASRDSVAAVDFVEDTVISEAKTPFASPFKATKSFVTKESNGNVAVRTN